MPAEAIYWTAIALDPDGRFLYALGYLEGSGVLLVDVFAIDQAAGTLSFVAREKGGASHQVLNRGLQAPLVLRDFVVVGGPANGNSLQDRPVVTVYRRDPDPGHPEPRGAAHSAGAGRDQRGQFSCLPRPDRGRESARPASKAARRAVIRGKGDS